MLNTFCLLKKHFVSCLVYFKIAYPSLLLKLTLNIDYCDIVAYNRENISVQKVTQSLNPTHVKYSAGEESCTVSDTHTRTHGTHARTSIFH